MTPVTLARAPGLRRLLQVAEKVEDDVVLFKSWSGKYADSPRAISEELHRRGSPLRQRWVSAGGNSGFPDWVTQVEVDSREYLAALGGAGSIVTNNTLPGYFRKKRGTTHLQTWHGTPLKRIAFDVPASSAAVDQTYLRNLAREVAGWDYLISPNRFSTEVLRSAFRFDGEILETGYPRNDELSSPKAPVVRSSTRDRLGIGADTTALLYCPTWRDGRDFSLELDTAAIEAALGDGHVILLRTHGLVGPLGELAERRNVIDVSSIDDARELFLAADVLITDYSSVMFDFAVTGKPMLFFTYDLEEYRDVLRGFYFEFEADAPGPLLRTTGEVIEALGAIDSIASSHAAAYAAFRDRFCHLDDGRAAARVVDAVFDKDQTHG